MIENCGPSPRRGGPFPLPQTMALGQDSDMTQLDLDTPDARRGAEADANAPLAELLRPKDLSEVVGQEALLGPQGRLRRMLDGGELASIIF